MTTRHPFWAIRRIDRNYVEPTLYKTVEAATAAANRRLGYDVIALSAPPAPGGLSACTAERAVTPQEGRPDGGEPSAAKEMLQTVLGWVLQSSPEEYVDWLIDQKTPGFEMHSREEWKVKYRAVIDKAWPLAYPPRAPSSEDTPPKEMEAEGDSGSAPLPEPIGLSAGSDQNDRGEGVGWWRRREDALD